MRALQRTLVLALALLVGACATLGGGSSTKADHFRVMSFNIRLDLASDGPNAWPYRRDMVADVIRHEGPALLGMQEVLPNQKADLEAALPDYTFVGVARDDGAAKGEYSLLAIRRDRFDLLESGTFWLSPTPIVPGKAWDAAFPRIATWALLNERKSDRKVAVLNTHFDHIGTEARLNSATMVADWAVRHAAKGYAIVVMGDFNAETTSPPIAMLSNHARSGLRLARAATIALPYGPPGTFNAFKIDADAAQPIDHIFVSDAFAVLRYATVTQHWGGRLPSDHYPVVADLEVRR